MLAVNSSVYTVRCESVYQTNEVLYFGSRSLCMCRSGSIGSLTGCPAFTAVFCNPGFVGDLLMMSVICLLSQSHSRLFLFILCIGSCCFC